MCSGNTFNFGNPAVLLIFVFVIVYLNCLTQIYRYFSTLVNTMENYSSNIKQRILKLIDNQGLSKRAFYKKTGISNGLLDKSTGFSEESIVKFLHAFPEVNTEWLIIGSGEIYKNDAVREPSAL